MAESMSDINHHDKKANDNSVEGKNIAKAFYALL